MRSSSPTKDGFVVRGKKFGTAGLAQNTRAFSDPAVREFLWDEMQAFKTDAHGMPASDQIELQQACLCRRWL